MVRLYMASWLDCYIAIWLYGYDMVRLYVAIWLYGMVQLVHGMDVHMPYGCMAIWLYSYGTVWMCMSIWQGLVI